MRKRFKNHHWTKKNLVVLASALVFSIIGVILLLNTYAATFSISVTPAYDTPTGPITPIVDPITYDGSIKFGTAGTASTVAINNLDKATTLAQADQAMDAFLAPYSMTAQITSVTLTSAYRSSVSYTVLTDADLPQLKTYGTLFIQEWSKYPVSFVRYSKVRSVALTKNLVVASTVRAAMPDGEGDVMFYDVGYGGDYARGVVHHEFDHLVTYNNFNTYSPADPTWRSYNPAGFTYGNGGSSCYEEVNNCLTGQHPILGFATGYAASGIEEDKAELFSYLMTRNYYQRLKTWLPTDSSLTNKVNYYKQYLASKSPEMAGSYFDNINQ